MAPRVHIAHDVHFRVPQGSDTPRRRHLLPTTAVRIGVDFVSPSSAIRDLIDSDVSMWSHVSRTVSGSFAVLRQIRTCSFRRSVSASVFTSLVVLLVMPRLQYGNATLAGLPEYQHRRLQSVLNAAASTDKKFSYRRETARQLHTTTWAGQLTF